MSYWVAGAAITAAVIGAGATVYASDEASKAADIARKQNLALAKQQQDAADAAMNAANKKSPDTAGFLAANAQAAKGGQSGTSLTGTSGVSPTSLTLGKSTLLGG